VWLARTDMFGPFAKLDEWPLGRARRYSVETQVGYGIKQSLFVLRNRVSSDPHCGQFRLWWRLSERASTSSTIGHDHRIPFARLGHSAGRRDCPIYRHGCERSVKQRSYTTTVFDDNSKEVRIVQKSLALPNGTDLPVVITLEGRKQ